MQVRGIDPQRCEQPRLQIIQYALASYFLYHSAEHIGGHAVVVEQRTGLAGNVRSEEFLPPFLRITDSGFLLVAGTHAQQVADFQLFHIGAGAAGQQIGKEIQHAVFLGQQSLLNGKAHRRTGEALAQRVQHMALLL